MKILILKEAIINRCGLLRGEVRFLSRDFKSIEADKVLIKRCKSLVVAKHNAKALNYIGILRAKQWNDRAFELKVEKRSAK